MLKQLAYIDEYWEYRWDHKSWHGSEKQLVRPEVHRMLQQSFNSAHDAVETTENWLYLHVRAIDWTHVLMRFFCSPTVNGNCILRLVSYALIRCKICENNNHSQLPDKERVSLSLCLCLGHYWLSGREKIQAQTNQASTTGLNELSVNQ